MERKLLKLLFYIGFVVYVSGGNGGVLGCMYNYLCNVRLMESVSGVFGVKELNESGIFVEILEVDEDNIVIL